MMSSVRYDSFCQSSEQSPMLPSPKLHVSQISAAKHRLGSYVYKTHDSARRLKGFIHKLKQLMYSALTKPWRKISAVAEKWRDAPYYLEMFLRIKPTKYWLNVTSETYGPIQYTFVIDFLSRVSILLLTRDIDIVILSVCPSVRPSVCPSVRDTLVLYENGLTYRHSFSTIR